MRRSIRRCSERMQRRKGCVSVLINALKLLANQQKGGESVIQCIVTGLHAKSGRGIMNGLRRLIES